MDGYAVKVDELGKLIADLDTAADRMADANRKLGGGGVFGSLGNAELGRAGAEFEEAWGYGIERLGDAAVGITERLKQAKGKYEQIEAQFGGELGKFGSDVFGSGDGPVGGGITGGMPGVGELADRGERSVGGGYTGGVAGIDDLAERAAADERPVGGGATGGITDLLNGLGR
ncbi:hypothetical protein [Amycolatopsis sp. WQ 127309]|uniref:hypothetical protein n=1 Tax=Amycolatopsis sp. WQ 127309 TaxID=2932773 RepID=UPI001FF4501E|nr:hypothetical protein [Amycolatopsis sp. WQ 127309]UOZ08569.1 hypothetical protein MUY22_09960 [Amycolatopsis sp. WQ 127309]